jgi:hypothetical protein
VTGGEKAGPAAGLVTPSLMPNPDANPDNQLLFTQLVGGFVGVAGVRFTLLPRARPYVRAREHVAQTKTNPDNPRNPDAPGGRVHQPVKGDECQCNGYSFSRQPESGTKYPGRVSHPMKLAKFGHEFT